jgi:hypothetical protein
MWQSCAKNRSLPSTISKVDESGRSALPNKVPAKLQKVIGKTSFTENSENIVVFVPLSVSAY